ncbi:MAG TPA: pantetheine-phosphate adenylyltransferase [Candidatus Hydrogenedentes bacterium]|nr:pantetheine-phosphate adenylyltransferase [Candidatus Hydrogenedentota bacterium]
MPERSAVYPGSFDPPTLGHLDLIERAARIFDRLIVAVAVNNEKHALFSASERVDMLQMMTNDLQNVEVTHFEGLTAEFARERGAVALVRGLRALSDFEFELSLAIMNQKLCEEIDTVCMMPSEPYLFLSSRAVKEICRFGGDTSSFLTPEVSERLQAKLLGQ